MARCKNGEHIDNIIATASQQRKTTTKILGSHIGNQRFQIFVGLDKIPMMEGKSDDKIAGT